MIRGMIASGESRERILLSIGRCLNMGLFERRGNMKETLQPGIEHEFTFTITEAKTVPALYPEASDLQAMPHVFATGFLVGLIEWTCIQAVNPFLDWPEEQSVGTHINVSHLAATPPGFKVTAKVRLVEVDGRRLVFEVEAHDGVDLIARGSHERFVINQDKFNRKIKSKAEKA
jgi:fluoroacetyl-CoA thioesterase